MGICFGKAEKSVSNYHNDKNEDSEFHAIENNNFQYEDQIEGESTQINMHFEFPNKYARYIDATDNDIFSIGDNGNLRIYQLQNSFNQNRNDFNLSNSEKKESLNLNSKNKYQPKNSFESKENNSSISSPFKKISNREYKLQSGDGTCISRFGDKLIAGFRNGNIISWSYSNSNENDKSLEHYNLKDESKSLNWICNSKIKAHDLTVMSVEFSPFSTNHSTHFVSGSRDQVIKLWDYGQQTSISECYIARNLINDFCWLNPNSFVQVGEDKRIRLFDSRNIMNPTSIWNNDMIITMCDAKPSEEILENITSAFPISNSDPSTDQSKYISELSSESESKTFTGREIRPTEQFLVTQKGSTSACSIFTCDIRMPDKYLKEYKGHELGIVCARYIDSKTICSTSNDQTVRIWEEQVNSETVFHLSDAPTSMTVLNDKTILLSTMSQELIVSKSSSGLWNMDVLL